MRPAAPVALQRTPRVAGPVHRARRAVGPQHGDRGDIVVGWLVRIILTCAIAGVVLFDLISIGVAKMSVTDNAETAARAASSAWSAKHDNQSAFDAAWTAATQANEGNTVDTHTFRVDADGTAHVTVHRTASTILVRLIGPIRDWADVQGDGSGRADP
jgi:hypothetical protein